MHLGHFNAYILLPLLERFSGRNVKSKLKELHRFESVTRSEQLQIQKNQLYQFLVYCKTNVPYYRETIRLDLEKIKKDIRYVQDLPLLTKDKVRDHTIQLRSPMASVLRKTGGSTGTSVMFYYDAQGLDWTAAINLRAYEMAGKKLYQSQCHIAAELQLHPTTLKSKVKDAVIQAAHNRKRLMIDSFSDQQLSLLVSELKKNPPYLLQGHPSSAYAMANYIDRKHLKIIPLCAVFEPSGEALNDKMVIKIKKAFQCRVVNRYGNAEFGVVAHSEKDDYKKLKVFDRAFYAEEGQAQNLIVTNFTNFGFPLVRYDTGDVATVNNREDGTFISDLRGRIHDLVKIDQDVFATHYIMDFLDHRVQGVREFQIVIQDSKLPLLNIAAEYPSDHQRIRNEVLKRFPKGLAVEIVNFDQFKTVGWRSKFRHVVNKSEIQNEIGL